MAKRVKGATITFEVTDDGTLKQVGKRAKTASKDVDKLGKSAGDTRRNLQSMSGRTESASKSFSRLQQGTGGLVQSYAILASTVFAVTAAFRALENAQNIQAQIKGFEELTKITGTSMLTITNSVRAAADGLLDFQTAAQQTAIATAAGFDSSQIIGLTEGAKNASVALGRDMTDSFNRLIRGVTKAEPELLDELGVILRLDIATRNYAASIGASADKLTIAQRRTAVYNEVQKQLEDNFGSIAPKADDLTNNISKFVTKLGDIGITISKFVLPFVNAFVNFLTNNLPILVGLLSIFGLRLLNDIVPGLSKVGSATTQWVSNSEKEINRLNKQLDKNAAKYKQVAAKNTKVENQFTKAFRMSLKKRGMSEKEFFQVKSPANQKRSITAHINALKKQEKATGKSMKTQIAIQRTAYKKIEQMAGVTGKKIGLSIDSGVIIAQKGLLRLKLQGQKVFSSLSKQAIKFGFVFRGLAMLMNFAMGAFMAISMVTMFVDMIPAVRKAKEAVEALKEETKLSTERTLELSSATQAFNSTKLEKVNDEVMKLKDTATDAFNVFVAMDKALQHLANTFDNSPMENAEQDVLKQVETGLVNGKMKGFFGGDTKAAVEAGKIFGTKLIDGIGQAMLADAEGTKKIMVDFFGDIGESQGFNQSQKNNLKSVHQLKGAEIFDRIQKMNTGDFTKNETEQMLDQILKDMRRFGVTASQIFEIIEVDGVKSIKMLEGASQVLKDVAEVPEKLKHTVKSIADMDKPMENFIEQMNLAIPRPTELQKRSSAMNQIFNQMNSALKNKGIEKAMEEMLSEEAQKQLKLLNKEITMRDIVVFKLEHGLNIEKELAELLVDKNEILTEHARILNKTSMMSKSIGTVNKLQLKLMNQLKDSHTKRQSLLVQQEHLEKEITINKAKQQDMSLVAKGMQESEKDAQNQKIMDLQTQTMEMEGQLKLLENQLDKFFQIKKVMIEAFDSAGNTALTDIIEGGSGTDAIKKMAEDMDKQVSKSIAGTIMEKATGGVKKLLGMNTEVKLTPEAQAIQLVHDKHVKDLDAAMKAHAAAFGHKYTEDADTKFFSDMREKFGSNLAITKDGEKDLFTEDMFDLDIVKNKFSGFFDGLFGKLGGLFGGGGGGGLMSTIGSFFGLERGGVIGLAKGGITRYAKGGVATQPTYLVGEGKQNEAVVPLPDNKSIPVDLGRGANSTNNTNISVNIAESGTTTKMEAEGAEQMAGAINMAVLAEIEKQQRPGGLLGA